MKFLNVKKTVAPLMLIVVALLLSGCNANIYLERYVPKDSDKMVRNYITSIAEGDFDTAKKAINPKFITKDINDKFAEVREKIGGARPEHIVLKKFDNTYKYPFHPDIVSSYLLYELKASGEWFRASVVVDRGTKRQYIYGFFIEPIAGPFSEVNAFKLSGKSFFQYALIPISIFILIFIIHTALLCLRVMKGEQMKWPWFVFILFGAGAMSMNWTTGELAWQLFSAQFLGSGMLRDGLDGPWVLTTSMPLGAIFFYFKHSRWKPEVEEAVKRKASGS